MDITTSLSAWLFTAIASWVPPAQHRAPLADTTARYESIASDLAAVALDPAEAPLFVGPDGRARTALLLASTARFESTFRADIDQQTVGTGDGGVAFCLGQLHGRYATGLTDRQSCIRGMLHALRDSMGACSKWQTEDQLSLYTTGSCRGHQRESRLYVGLATSYWHHNKFEAVQTVANNP